MRVSGSRVDLAMACGYAFNGQEWPEDQGSTAASVGTAFHYIAAKLVNKSEAMGKNLIDHAIEAAGIEAGSPLVEQVRDMIPEALYTEDEPGDAEIAYAWDYETGAARVLGIDIGRNYNLGPNEIAGSADIVGCNGNQLYVADWKTGQKPPAARGNGQLMFSAMCANKLVDYDEVRLEIRHVRGGGEVWVDSDVVSRFDLDAFETELQDAIRAIPASKPKPGPHCAGKYCPLRSVCPATVGTIAEDKPAYPLALREAGEIQGAAHVEWLLHRIDSAEELLSTVKARIRQYVDTHGPVELSDGRKYGPYVVVRESIEGPKDKLLEAGIPEALIEYSVSKGAVEKAAKDAAERGKGAAAARAAIERLRDAGCVKESSFIKYEARK